MRIAARRNLLRATLLALGVATIAEARAAADAPVSARVHGVVVDEAGRPVAGIGVRVDAFSSSGAVGVTDAAGAFRLSTRMPFVGGTLVIASTADGGRQGSFRYDVAIRDAETPRGIRIVLGPSREFRALVVDPARAPVAGASVEVMGYFRPLSVATTDARGMAMFRIPVDLPYTKVVALKSGVGLDAFEFSGREGGTPAVDVPVEVTLTLDGPRSARIRAIDSGGRPIEGVEFSPQGYHKPGAKARINLAGSSIARVKTDAGGIAAFDWLPRNQTDMFFLDYSRSYHAPRRPTFAKGETTATIEARLLRIETIRGKVVHPDGTPAAGIPIHTQAPGGYGRSPAWARTAADGSYELAAPAEKSYIVAVIADDCAAPSRAGVVVREGKPVAGVDFRLGKGTLIRGRIAVGPAKIPGSSIRVMLSQEGEPLPADIKAAQVFAQVQQLDREATADADGRYSFRVGPGSYTLRGPSRSQAEEIEVGDEAELVRDFFLPRPEQGGLTGRVVVAPDEVRGIKGAIVEGMNAGKDHNPDMFTTADAEGRFAAIRRLDPMVVLGRSPDGSLAGIVEIGPDDTEVIIPVAPTAIATGLVVDKIGQPLANRELECGIRVHRGDKNGSSRLCFSPKVVTDALGRFVLPAMVVGREYSIELVVGRQAVDIATVTPSKPGPIDLGLRRIGAGLP